MKGALLRYLAWTWSEERFSGCRVTLLCPLHGTFISLCAALKVMGLNLNTSVNSALEKETWRFFSNYIVLSLCLFRFTPPCFLPLPPPPCFLPLPPLVSSSSPPLLSLFPPFPSLICLLPLFSLFLLVSPLPLFLFPLLPFTLFQCPDLRLGNWKLLL